MSLLSRCHDELRSLITILLRITHSLTFSLRLFIDGKFVDAVDGATFETTDPASGKVITSVVSVGGGVELVCAESAEAQRT